MSKPEQIERCCPDCDSLGEIIHTAFQGTTGENAPVFDETESVEATLLRRVNDETDFDYMRLEHETDGETFHAKDCLRCELNKFFGYRDKESV